MSVLSFLLANKLLVFFSLATVALCVSTIVLAVQYSNLQDEVEDLKEQLSSTTTTTTTTTTSTTPGDIPSTEAPEEMTNYLLPNNVIPIHYDLYLYPDLSEETSGNFEGKVVIRVSVKESTETVKLHNNGLTIKSVTVDGATSVHTTVTTYELLIITPENGPLNVGTAEISIEFSGSMENRIVGLYISSYTNSEGEVSYITGDNYLPTQRNMHK